MWKQAFSIGGRRDGWRCLSTAASPASPTSASGAVNSLILRSLKDHYIELSKMTPPPKVNPPAAYSVIKGALDNDGPVLRREYRGEEINISVMRLSNIMPAGAEEDDADADADADAEDSISQLFLHVDVSKPCRNEGLQFLCGLYPDAVGIHSVCLRPNDASADSGSLSKHRSRLFQELDQKMRDGFHMYIEARGVSEKLFPFLQAWLYVKDHRNLMNWFKRVGTFINEPKTT